MEYYVPYSVVRGMSNTISTFDNRKYVMEMVAAILERGDSQIREGWSGGKYSDANWVTDLLLGELGYEVHVDEDGNVSIWDKDHDPESPVYEADHYREEE